MTANDDGPRLRRLDRTVLTLWRLWAVLGAVVGLLGAAVLVATGAPPSVPAAVAGVAGVGGGVAWWWASRRFARLAFRVTDEVLELWDGVVLQTAATVPLFRVQHIDIGRGPLERLLDLSTLVVHTAAPAADVVVPGIRAADATAVRDEILAASRAAAARHGIEDLDAV